MRLRLLAFSLVLMATPAAAQKQQSPITFVVNLFEHFMAGDMDDYAERFAYPHGRVLGNQFSIVEERKVALGTYELMRQTGWAYSKLNEVNVLEENAHSALVRVNFDRFGNQGELIQKVTAYYTLVNEAGAWKIVNLMAVGQSLPGMQMESLGAVDS
ncbi:MAG: hypothetical protein ACE363_07475 [Alphaproteobacteria bacterium]